MARAKKTMNKRNNNKQNAPQHRHFRYYRARLGDAALHSAAMARYDKLDASVGVQVELAPYFAVHRIVSITNNAGRWAHSLGLLAFRLHPAPATRRLNAQRSQVDRFASAARTRLVRCGGTPSIRPNGMRSITGYTSSRSTSWTCRRLLPYGPPQRSHRSACRAGERADKGAVLRIAGRAAPLFLRWLSRDLAV